LTRATPTFDCARTVLCPVCDVFTLREVLITRGRPKSAPRVVETGARQAYLQATGG